MDEARKYFGRPDVTPPGLSDFLKPLSSEEAQTKFLARFDEIDRIKP